MHVHSHRAMGWLSRVAALGLLAAAACSASSGKKPDKERPAEDGQRVAVFVTAELRGTIEPCGCTSDPLGDLARTAQVIASARAEPGLGVVYVEGGSTLYSEVPVPDHLRAQEALKADLIAAALTGELGVAAAGLGPNDFGAGTAGIRPPRQAANVSPDSGVPLAPPSVLLVNGTRIGVFGVVAPEALADTSPKPASKPEKSTAHAPIAVGDPTAAAVEAVADLRGQGAQIVIGLAYMPRRDATRLARAVAGIDFLVIGQDAPEPDDILDAPSRAGDTWLVQPANRGQSVVRLDIAVRGDRDDAQKSPAALVDAIGEARAKREIARLDEELETLAADVARWKQSADADPAFVATKERELASKRDERAALIDKPLQAPATGSWFTMQQIRIAKGLDCHAEIQAAKLAFDKAAGAANVAAAAGKQPPPPPPGTPGFIGVEECGFCHAEAVTFWNKTKHHEAWETLEKVGKQFNYDCIQCHVTGWDRPGGSNMAVNEALRDVQCEVCHGPGSIHAEADGKESPKTMILSPREALCKTCHSPEHSDTFDYQAYLRDVTGPGHGAAFREALGDGPTGGGLREAALEKAGAKIGARCLK